MLITQSGSTWKKWDLHVHTPESLVHHYPGEKETAWEAFLADFEALPAEFKVIGINDYLFVDGYARVLEERRRGRLQNVELVLPVVELRLDKFGGVLEHGPDGRYAQSSWSRINLHVIFDEVEPRLIQDQFIAAISRRYTLIPGMAEQWGGVITRENLIALGNAVIGSMPEHLRANAPSPLKVGFNNLNVSYEGVREALDNPLLAGKSLIAIGKTEWESMRWNDNNIADKKTVINEADLVFTASPNPEAYARARAALKGANVNDRLLDCSDAHSLSTENIKDRIGNCFTWIKADSTFQGLTQAIEEFDDRVYVGDNPPKRGLVEQNKTKFIRAVRITKKQDSTLAEPWFSVNMPLNCDLVAIIGNKGSGKSALSDVIALAGNTRHYGKFSFLKDTRFRSPKTKFAQHFVGEIEWHDGLTNSRELDRDPDSTGVERVKYLPQSYLEDLCNDLGDGGSATFDAELRKIIYSHVPEADRLGKSSMDDLLDYKVAELNQGRQVLRQKIGTANQLIVELERRLTLEHRRSLEEQLGTKQAELNALDSAKPQAVEDPNASPEAATDAKQAAESIEALENEARNIDKEVAALGVTKLSASKRLAVTTRIAQALSNYQKQHESFVADLRPLVTELGANISVEALIEIRIDMGLVDATADLAKTEIEQIDISTRSEEPGSFTKRKQELAAAITDAKSKLGERQRQFVLYREALANWEKAKTELIGEKDKPDTITALLRG
ncbi:TrlF family AAA-like ATPase [Paraburkholderia dilworthii]|uniref:ABC transporter n=1 Tax=Paraburkholderia dilworthii TaxID=948106 RepID=A0ABW9D0C7_9BURK